MGNVMSQRIKTSIKLVFKFRETEEKKNRNTPTYFNANYLTEMKLVPIIMDYCLLQFNALKFFLGVRHCRGCLPNFNFFNLNPQIFQQNRNVHLSIVMFSTKQAGNKFSQHFYHWFESY